MNGYIVEWQPNNEYGYNSNGKVYVECQTDHEFRTLIKDFEKAYNPSQIRQNKTDAKKLFADYATEKGHKTTTITLEQKYTTTYNNTPDTTPTKTYTTWW